MLYCFLDTNILLQFAMLDQIDWQREFGDSDICLVIPYDVIGELDKHKSDPISNRRLKRARSVLAKIEGWVGEEPIRDNTILKIPDEKPTREWMREHGYDPEEPDDRIIASVEYFKENVSSQVVLVTDDTGVRLKAKARSIEGRPLPDEFRLPPEPDPLQQELETLRRENEKLKNTHPKIQLGFYSDNQALSNSIQLEYVSPDSVELPDIEAVIDARRVSLEYRGDEFESPPYGDQGQVMNLLAQASQAAMYSRLPPSEEEILEYPAKLEEHLKEYRMYLKSGYVCDLFKVQNHLIEISLENSGNTPAQDIDVSLHFPYGVMLLSEPPMEPEEPYPPPKPQPRPFFEAVITSSLLDISSSAEWGEGSSNGEEWPIIEYGEDGILIKNHLVYLKHHQNWVWEPLYLTFGNTYDQGGFEISYKIVVANLPEPIEGKLNILTSRVDRE